MTLQADDAREALGRRVRGDDGHAGLLAGPTVPVGEERAARPGADAGSPVVAGG